MIWYGKILFNLVTLTYFPLRQMKSVDEQSYTIRFSLTKKINKQFKKKVRPTLFRSELRMSKPFESLKSLTLVPFGS